ncbi:MAG TPA: anthrone oxygenase family protein [Chitinophagaceae bacterium]|nr:anthrone oxygenase family protein [Chitinophagaceae bacterium]
MTLRQKLFIIFIWLAVINLSIWVGGTLFHMIVVLPIWSQPLPGSVKEFFGGTSAYEYLLDFYGPKWMVIRILPIIITLLLAWNSKRQRNFLLITVSTIALGIILTILYVYPINDAIMAKAGEDSSPEEITRMVQNWIKLDRLRFAVIFIGYLFLLWAFRLPIPYQKKLQVPPV